MSSYLSSYCSLRGLGGSVVQCLACDLIVVSSVLAPGSFLMRVIMLSF